MKTFPRIHDVYVGRIVFGTVLLVWVVLLGLDLMLGFVSEFGDIGRGNYGTPQAILYMAFSVPRRAYTLFPYAAVVGALMALGQLAASSELTALRAAGVTHLHSPWANRHAFVAMVAAALTRIPYSVQARAYDVHREGQLALDDKLLQALAKAVSASSGGTTEATWSSNFSAPPRFSMPSSRSIIVPN